MSVVWCRVISHYTGALYIVMMQGARALHTPLALELTLLIDPLFPPT